MEGASIVARGVGINFVGYVGKIARPVALVVFPRLYGLDAVGTMLVVWAYILIAAQLSALGFDKGLQWFLPASEEKERTHHVGAALWMSLGASILAALILWIALPYLSNLPSEQLLPARLTLLFSIPVLSLSTVALNAIRATKRVGPLVVARGVIEPIAFLLSGLLLALVTRHPSALLGAQLLSVVVAGLFTLRFLGKHFPLGELFGSFKDLSYGSSKPLLRFSATLGLAEGARLTLLRVDVPVVGAMLGDGALTGAYGIAREVVTSLAKVQQSFDQIVAPVSAELHKKERSAELSQVVTMSARWSLAIAAPLALVLMILGDMVLPLFSVPVGLVTVALAILAAGRTFDCVATPAAVLLGMTGRSRAVLINALLGLGMAGIFYVFLIPTYGASGAAVATTLGLVLSNVLSVVQLIRWEQIKPFDFGLFRVLLAALIAALGLTALRPVLEGYSESNLWVAGLVLSFWAVGYLLLLTGLLPEERRSLRKRFFGAAGTS